jgi:negative regulator of replication initiation
MKTIQVSEEVWNEIVKRGKFGETTADHVLRRIFGIQTPRKATIRMSVKVVGNRLVIQFENGQSNMWDLPDSTDRAGIRAVRDSAVSFAIRNEASIGQQNAVKKALTDAGYYVSR